MDDGSGRRKRRRPAKSCEPCRQRKVRCDLNQPCGPCSRAKASLTCAYRDEGVSGKTAKVPRGPDALPQAVAQAIGRSTMPTPTSLGVGVPSPNDDLQPAVHDLQARLGNLEARLSRGESSGVHRSTLEKDLHALTQRVQAVEDQLAKGSNAVGTRARDRTSVAAVPPRLRHSARKVKFLGPSHWCNKMDKLCIAQLMSKKDIGPPLRGQQHDAVNAVKECRDLRRTVKSQRSVKLDDPLPDVLSTVPPREECDELVGCYLRTFEPIYRVLHIPSFWMEYEEFWKQPQSNMNPFLTKLLLILAIGTVFRSGQGNRPRDEYDQLAQKWIYAAQWWLAGPSEGATCNIDGLQVSCLLFISRKACGLGSSPWLSAGSLMRMAVAMGLHRDPSEFPGLSWFQSEIRRRLWATVLELALQESLDLGLPCLVPVTFDTNPPSNINDPDFSPDLADPPILEPRERCTDASIQLLLYESVKLRMQVLEVINDYQEQSYQHALELGRRLRAAHGKVVAFFRSAKIAENDKSGLELNEFHRKFLDIQLHKSILALYTPFVVQARKDPQFYYARKACLESVTAIASHADSLHLPSHVFDDISRLFISGKGSFKGPLSLDVIATLGLEIVTQIDEECLPERDGGLVDRLAGTSRDGLIHTLEHILDQLFHIIALGTPSMKRFGLLAAVLGEIRAMKAGLDVTRTVYEAVTQAFKDCHSTLQQSAMKKTEAVDGLAPGANVPGEFDLPDPSLLGFDVDLGDAIFGIDFQSLFPFADLDNGLGPALG
ncbi:Zn(II)2Cys6 transcription factor [Aspergillus lucknowensis]|uniref:Zn(2)-C6 fungal-type domain-containing protein n=1 Tax=Aspergillus lucknowensis TaxID=176173 RepID=A0ABR4L8W8_9EURO